MKFPWIILSAALILTSTGCAIFEKPPTKGEIAVRKFNLNELKIGDNEKTMLKIFPNARRQPFGRVDRHVYEITNPNPSISLAIAYFMDDRLIKLELRYFNGPSVHTLTTAGGWNGLRDYMIAKFGPPTRTGELPLQTEAPDMNSKYAQFSGEWAFPKEQRLLQYIAFSGAKGGIGVVTMVDCSPFVTNQQAGALQSRSTTPALNRTPSANPGF